jgi:hypothetical protein
MNIEYTIPLVNFPESYSQKYEDPGGSVDFTYPIDNGKWFDMQTKLISNIFTFEKQFLLATGSVGLLPGERKKAARRARAK